MLIALDGQRTTNATHLGMHEKCARLIELYVLAIIKPHNGNDGLVALLRTIAADLRQ